MCGIVGAYYFEQEPELPRLKEAVKRLQHRGPDESGTCVFERVALGHTRLSIIDLQGGKQPLSSKDQNLHLVANGEIYNYLEVAAAHPEYSKSAISRSDSEAILHVYRAHGDEGIAKLCGMYAFALYDQEQDKLVLGRDRLGIKPLYYAQTTRGVFFASEIKALLALMDYTPAISSDGLVQYLQNQFNTGDDSIVCGIKRLMPGEYAVVNKSGVQLHRYWDLLASPTSTLPVEQAFQQFETLFEEVMEQHMRSDVPFGLFLSGGIDSSVLLAQLTRMGVRDLNTYSIGYTGVKMEDELSAADALAEKFNTKHRSIRVSRDDLFARIVRSIWAADDLMRDYASLPTLLLSEYAVKDVKVVFSGEAGDEAFAGYRRYAPNLARWINHRVLGRGIRAQGQWHAEVSEAVFTPQLKACDAKAPFKALWDSAPKHWSLMKKRQFVDLNAALVDNLFVKTDRMMMAEGLEGRVPLADHRIVEFGFALPDKLKYRNKMGKWFLRQWAHKYLPAEHLRKPKRGFYVPIKEWLRGDFLKQLEHKLTSSDAIQEWFNIEGVRSTLAQQAKGKNYSREIWGLMQFAIWHKLFIQDPGCVPSENEDPMEWL